MFEFLRIVERRFPNGDEAYFGRASDHLVDVSEDNIEHLETGWAADNVRLSTKMIPWIYRNAREHGHGLDVTSKLLSVLSDEVHGVTTTRFMSVYMMEERCVDMWAALTCIRAFYV